ncbi:MAG: RNA methyltransferase [Patescibacteria group bacterium]
MFYVICHNIRSLHNIGSIFRTADGAAVSKIFLCGITGTPPRKEISKVALGAENFVPWEKHRQTARLIKKLKNEGIKIAALEQSPKSVRYDKFKPKFPLALVLGEETKGLPKKIMDLCDAAIEIPMFGKKESLNVSVAFGVAAYEILKHLTINQSECSKLHPNDQN